LFSAHNLFLYIDPVSTSFFISGYRLSKSFHGKDLFFQALRFAGFGSVSSDGNQGSISNSSDTQVRRDPFILKVLKNLYDLRDELLQITTFAGSVMLHMKT